MWTLRPREVVFRALGESLGFSKPKTCGIMLGLCLSLAVTAHALPVPVVRFNDRERLVASSAGSILRYRHRQNRYATAASASARPINPCISSRNCTGLWDVQKLKQLSRSDSAISTLSVHFRPLIRATLRAQHHSLLPLPCHLSDTDCLFSRLCGVVSTGEII